MKDDHQWARPLGTTRVPVRVHPRSKRQEVRLAVDGGVEVWTSAPPLDGRANEAVCQLLAAAAGIPSSAVTIVSGARSRVKIIAIQGIDEAGLRARLAYG